MSQIYSQISVAAFLAQAHTWTGLQDLYYSMDSGSSVVGVGLRLEQNDIAFGGTTSWYIGSKYGAGTLDFAPASDMATNVLTLSSGGVATSYGLSVGSYFVPPKNTTTVLPIKFTLPGAALVTTPQAGGFEAVIDDIYYTVNTGTARKKIALTDAALTSGKLPIATTNGRLTDASSTGYAKLASGTLSASATIPASDITGLPATVGYCLTAFHASLNPADSTTYFWGCFNSSNAPGTTGGVTRVYIPKTGTVKAIVIGSKTTVQSSNENITYNFVLNNSSTTAITTTGQLTAAFQVQANYALSIPVVQGDYFEISMVCPAWATNPTVLFEQAAIYIE